MNFTIISPFYTTMSGIDVTSAIKQFAKQYYFKKPRLNSLNITFRDNQNNYYDGSIIYFMENGNIKVKIIVNQQTNSIMNPRLTNSFINYPQIPIVRLPLNALPFVGPSIIPIPIISPPVIGIANNGLPVILPSRPILPMNPYPVVVRY